MRTLLPTTLVGSYPQPDWLIDRSQLASRLPARIRAAELWRIPPPWLAAAQDDAALLAIRAQEDAGLDIVTDGEIRRESYSNFFATALEGLDLDHPATVQGRAGRPNLVPRIVGRIRRARPVEVENLRFLRAHTTKLVKVTLPGPFTMLQQASNEWYGSEEEAVMDYAAAVHEEVRDLFNAGADVVQLDEPYLQASPDKARRYGVAAVNRALEGITQTTCVHICFGYAAVVHERPTGYSFLSELLGCHCRQVSVETAQADLDCSILASLEGKDVALGVIDLSTEAVETSEQVAARIRRALPFVPANRIIVSTDCGMKYLSRASASGKLRSLVDGAAIVRRELGAVTQIA